MDRNTKVIASLILLLGLFLRSFWVDRSPPALNWDEVAHGYNSYSIMKTGSDEFGQNLPMTLRSFDDHKPALYSYLSIPFIKVFGLTELGVRSVSILSGVTVVASAMLIAKKIFKKNHIALLSGLTTAFSPWSLIFSRAAFEANLALALFTSGFAIYLHRKQDIKLFAFSIFLLTLSMHAYVANKIFVPILLAGIFIDNKRSFFKDPKRFTLPIVTAFIITMPLIYLHILHPELTGRFEATSLLTHYPSPIKTTEAILARYLSYFSPANLFVRGSAEPTQQTPGTGAFFMFDFLFISAGLLHLAKNTKKYKGLIFVILVSPIPAALTWNWFYIARVLPLFVSFSVLSGLGMHLIIAKLRPSKKIIAVPISLFLIILITTQVVRFTVTFYMGNQITEQGAWQFGMKEILAETAKYSEDYDQIIIETNVAQPHIFTLFYTKYPPSDYQLESKNVERPRKNFNFGKFTFRPVLWREDYLLRNTLFVAPMSSLPEDKVKEIEYVNLYKEVEDRFGNLQAVLVGTK